MYEFSSDNPPLMKDFPDIRSITDDKLIREIGWAGWQGDSASWVVVPQLLTRRAIKGVHHFSFNARRYYIWKILDGPTHFADDVDVTVKTTRGYKKIEKEVVEKNTNFSISGAFGNFNASVSSALRITNSFENEWHEESIREESRKFQKGHTYTTWCLCDCLEIFSSRQEIWFKDDPFEIVKEGVATPSHGVLSCIIANWEDSIADEKRRIIDSALINLAK